MSQIAPEDTPYERVSIRMIQVADIDIFVYMSQIAL